MSVELRHLRYFIALAGAKSFGRAATVLGIAQPALSQQIRKLECELDVVLFVRGNDGSHLTPAGEAFLPGAAASVADAADAVATAKRVGRGESGRLKVGFIGSSADNLIPAALRLFGKERPDVEISLTETDIAQLPGCFERNELDVAFVRRPVDDPTLLTELVLVDEVVAVLPDDHPLAGERSIPLSALAEDAWVVPCCIGLEGFPGDVRRRLQPQRLRADDRRRGVYAGGHYWCRRLRSRCLDVAEGIAYSLPRDGVCTVPIQGEESVVVMAWREDRRTPLASAFMHLMRQIAHPDRPLPATSSSPPPAV